MDISMDIHGISVHMDMDMDMDGKFHIHGKPDLRRHCFVDALPWEHNTRMQQQGDVTACD